MHSKKLIDAIFNTARRRELLLFVNKCEVSRECEDKRTHS